jgi:hypothetical protein
MLLLVYGNTGQLHTLQNLFTMPDRGGFLQPPRREGHGKYDISEGSFMPATVNLVKKQK